MTTGVVIGSREVASRLGGMPARLRDELRREVSDLTHELEGYIKSEKLTGQVLNVQTGRLRRSLNSRITVAGDNITGTVGTNVEYARIHEYGGTVKEHLRTITQAFGRPLKRPVVVKVHAYTLPERSFMRSGLKDRRAHIEGRLAAALYRVTGA